MASEVYKCPILLNFVSKVFAEPSTALWTQSPAFIPILNFTVHSRIPPSFFHNCTRNRAKKWSSLHTDWTRQRMCKELLKKKRWRSKKLLIITTNHARADSPTWILKIARNPNLFDKKEKSQKKTEHHDHHPKQDKPFFLVSVCARAKLVVVGFKFQSNRLLILNFFFLCASWPVRSTPIQAATVLGHVRRFEQLLPLLGREVTPQKLVLVSGRETPKHAARNNNNNSQHLRKPRAKHGREKRKKSSKWLRFVCYCVLR